MSECKVKINVDICGESALDAVTKLVVDGMSVNAACKKVAKEFNESNDGATVKPNSLRQSYIRANQKVATCSNSKVPNTSPTKTTTKTTPQQPCVEEGVISTIYVSVDKYKLLEEKHQEALKEIDNLKGQIKYFSEEFEKLVFAEAETKSIPGAIKREVGYEFVEKYGSTFQQMALKMDDLSNEQLYNIFTVVRESYLKTSPPQSLSAEILNATTIV